MRASAARAEEAAWRRELGQDPRALETAPAERPVFEILDELLGYGAGEVRGTVRAGVTIKA